MLLLDDVDRGLVARPEGEGLNSVDDLSVSRDAVSIDEGDDSVEVHSRAQPGAGWRR